MRWGELPTRSMSRAQVEKARVRPGDSLITTSGDVGKVAHVLHEPRGVVCVTNFVRVLRPNGRVLDPSYLYHYLSTSFVKSAVVQNSRGSTMQNLSMKNFLSTTNIPLPPIDEQRHIAAILDASDGAIRRRDEQLVALDRLIFSRIPVGQDGAIPLGAALKTIESGRSPNCEARPAMADEWGVLKLGAVSYGSYRADENKALLEAGGGGARYEVNAGDVLMTRKNTRDLVGAVAYVVTTPARRLLPDLIYRLTLDESQILPQYFQALMMTPLMRGRVGALASGSAASMVNLSHAKIKSLELPLASMGQQREYVAFADKVGKMRQLVECARVADRELLTSLQSRAFRGEL